GIDILNRSKSCICPLCSQEYQNFENLMLQISNGKDELLEVENLSVELRDMNIEKTALDSKIEEYLNRFNEKLLFEIQNIDERIIAISQKVNTLQLNKTEKQMNIYEMQHDLNNLKLLAIELGINTNDSFEQEKVVQELIAAGIEEQNKIAFEVTRINIVNKDLHMEINKLHHKKNVKTELLDQIEMQTRKLSLLQVYTRYMKLNNKIGSKDYVELQQNKEELISKVRILNEELGTINEYIQQYKTQEKSFTEITGDINKTEKELKDYQETINIYSDKYIRYFGDDNILEEQLRKEFDYLQFQIEGNSKQNELLNEVINNLNTHINNTLKITKEQDLNKFNKEYQHLRKIRKEIKTIKTTSLEYIKQKINNVFNLDSVNKIFQMIDPHPNVAEIMFKFDETSKDGLGLNIMCETKDNKSNSEAPILYLSSAQVNILSLSIFLASALENTEEIETILMDDPIQHLDGLNILSFIDLLRIICFGLKKQLIISTHDERFFKLIQKKIDPEYFRAKFLKLSSTGRVIN
ncbi:hypothetical protein, partial [Neobacillus drentensis]|uniref:hypothetical protein n=1 Tax=Neobacillus drentensis TaxID=220684 RepID=UPI002FFDC3B9